MTAGSCAKNFAAAPEAAKSGRLQGCIDCPVGAAHSGVPPTTKPAPAPLTYRSACLRCRRSGQEATSRLLGRMRLVRGHSICVSCYNREREVLQGANAKGAKPKKWSGLRILDAVYLKGGIAVRDRLAVPVLDPLEAMLTVLRVKGAPGVMWASPLIQRATGAGA